MSAAATNRVLMTAFHYPPCAVSSGIQRTLKFSRYLPEVGWAPIVLSAHPRAYWRTDGDQLDEIPPTVPVTRAFALDSARHLSFRGAYPRWIALPDQWATWWVGGVLSGLRLIRRHRPQVLWSTFPIATAQLIALTLHRLTGLPWVADFRDAMTEPGYPRDPAVFRSWLSIEQQAVARAARLIFTAESTRDMYLARYPTLPPEKCLLISNGYDEADFTGLVRRSPDDARRPLRLVHTGVIYPEERDPVPMFRALSRLKREGTVTSERLTIGLRASGSEDRYRKVVDELGIADLVRLEPPLPYRQALQECVDADGLLLLQGPSCNHQIPAKAYEYLRAARPILALTPGVSDTAALLRKSGGATIVDLGDEDAIHRTVPEFLAGIRDGSLPPPSPSNVQAYARHTQARELGGILSQVVGERPRRASE
jgi:glycosyltransferase involved in cell wall biosynthesis